jgi:hypothetical protein
MPGLMAFRTARMVSPVAAGSEPRAGVEAGRELVGDGGEIAPCVVEVLLGAGLFFMSDGHMSCLSGEEEKAGMCSSESALTNSRAAIL